MKTRKSTKLIGLSFAATFVFFIVFCKKDKLDIKDIDKDRIESFDIILSKGQSMQSKLISLLNYSTNDYSHIGIILKENGEVFVLHSTPDGTKMNGIRFDDLQTFIDLSNVSDCKILRHQSITNNNRLELSNEVKNYKFTQNPFDFDFDNFSNNRVYCSELVYLIFSKTGLIKKGVFDLSRPIHPKYFQNIEEFTTVSFMNTKH